MRLFFAVDFTDDVKDAIARAIRAFPVKHPPWRWVASANIHLTLKFLGDTPPEAVDALCEAAATTAAEHSPFTITFGGLGAFPDLKRPRVLFYRIEEGAGQLVELAQRLDERLEMDVGIAPEQRPFKAHATVARVKTAIPPPVIRALEGAPALEDTAQTVGRLSLIESHLGPQGARYHHVKEFALSKSK